jgi:hypothetical protein
MLETAERSNTRDKYRAGGIAVGMSEIAPDRTVVKAEQNGAELRIPLDSRTSRLHGVKKSWGVDNLGCGDRKNFSAKE